MLKLMNKQGKRTLAFALILCMLLTVGSMITPTANAESDAAGTDETVGTSYRAEGFDGASQTGEDGENAEGSEQDLKNPVITMQPMDYTLWWDPNASSAALARIDGMKARFSVEAEGEDLQYQWQVSADGRNWVDLTVYYAHDPDLMVAIKDNGYRYRCVVSNAAGSVVSDEARLISAPVGMCGGKDYYHPGTFSFGPDAYKRYTVHYGETVKLRCPVVGVDLSYQWTKNDVPIAGADARFLTVTLTEDDVVFKCTVTDNTGFGLFDSYIGASYRFRVVDWPIPRVTRQPQDAVARIGQRVSFSIEESLSGSGVSYQWEYSDDGGVNWSETRASGARTASITVTPTCAGYEGRMYRCRVWSPSGWDCSASAVLHVEDPAPPVITCQPEDYVVTYGENQKPIHTLASGTDLHYLWQRSFDGGITWQEAGSRSSDFDVFAMSVPDSLPRPFQCVFRCIVSNAGGTTVSDYAYYVVAEESEYDYNGPIDRHEEMSLPLLTQQPANVNSVLKDQAVFRVKATGDALYYRWQYSDDNGRNWKYTACSGYNTDTLTVPISGYGLQGRRFRCLVWNQRGAVSSESAVLTFSTDIYEPSTIVRQPQVQNVKYTDDFFLNPPSVVFTVEASGTNLSYQWQYSEDLGKTWKISACTAPSLSVRVSYTVLTGPTDNPPVGPRLYRCVITSRDKKDNGRTVYSNVVYIKTDMPFVRADDNSGIIKTNTLKIGDPLTIDWAALRSYPQTFAYQMFYEDYDTFVEYSDDGGATWTQLPCYGYGYPSSYPGEDGHLCLLIDSMEYDGRMYRMAWVYRGVTSYSASYLLSVSPPD